MKFGVQIELFKVNFIENVYLTKKFGLLGPMLDGQLPPHPISNKWRRICYGDFTLFYMNFNKALFSQIVYPAFWEFVTSFKQDLNTVEFSNLINLCKNALKINYDDSHNWLNLS